MTGGGAGPDTGVVIAGAGPVGLLLAGDLAEAGVRVSVVDELAEPSAESRASTLHTRSMELLAERGVLGGLGRLPSAGSGHFGGLPLDLTVADPEHPFAGQWKCPQVRLAAALERRAVAAGARIRRDQRVIELRRAPGRVTLDVVTGRGRRTAITGAYVVGCDGERSTVRRRAGFTLTGSAPARVLLRADVAGIDIPVRRFERMPGGFATAARWPDGSTRVMVHVRGSTANSGQDPPEFEEIAEAWNRVTGEDIGHGTPLWCNRFDDRSRIVARYRRGRVLLAGDAAHQQMPVGGQALNLGLQDAAYLGSRLAAHLTGTSGDSVLDDYDSIRHAAGVRVLAGIRAQTLLLLGGPETEPIRDLVRELLAFDDVHRHLARSISTPSAEPAGRARSATHPSEENSMSLSLTNKTALVTGSSRGIGRATARQLAAKGALVAVHYAGNEEAARETVAAIEGDGGRAFPIRAELGVPGDVHELFLALEQGLKERTGHTTLDILVNNAGVTTPAGQQPEDVTPEDFDRLFAVNAKAPFFIVQRALALLPEGGRVINISSGLTRFANPEQVAYSMTKGAIEQLTLHFARHLAPRGITVNSVAPGITDNGGAIFDIPEAVEQMAQLSAFKRVGEAVDVADVVAFLATDDARWITGAFVDATGGTLLG
ncbi:SDR family oxidoreductase [Nocardia sp. NPDC057227]|uniref:SDR family oxidoreductase n=1 Tax=Nocardia sp. NPDC057227 TaxID=3346056 RepID=UPI0036344661